MISSEESCVSAEASTAALRNELSARHGAVSATRGSDSPVSVSRRIRPGRNHGKRTARSPASAAEGVSARPGAAKYVFRSDIARRNYQLEAAAWKMSVTILSTIWGISSPSTSVSSFVES